MKTRLLEAEQHDLGIGTNAHRRAPRSSAARGVHLHIPEPLQAVRELAECASRDEVEGKYLAAAMSMA